jgi:pimeloyl-ACP methyl ester carboxylesterase
LEGTRIGWRPVSTPSSLTLPPGVQRITIETSRGEFAALEALPAMGVCERQPALLVPGFTGSKEDFISVLGQLAAAGRRVAAIDMRGQYESAGAAAAGAYSLAALAADVALIAEMIAARDGGPQRHRGVHVLGHSFGGLVARELALAQAAPVCSLTFMSSGPGALTGPRATVLGAVLSGLRSVAPGDLAVAIERLWESQLGPTAVADGVPPEVVAFLRIRMLSNCPVGLRSMAETLLSCPDRTVALADRQAAPMLVVYGEDDDAWAPAIQEDMAHRLGAQRVCIPGAAHSPAVEAPETVASTLTSFWNKSEARAPATAARAPLSARQP